MPSYGAQGIVSQTQAGGGRVKGHKALCPYGSGVAQRGGAATRDVPRPSWPCSGTARMAVAREGAGCENFLLENKNSRHCNTEWRSRKGKAKGKGQKW